MELFMKKILVRSVSNNRKGRGELVALVRNSQDIYEEGNDLTPLAKILGKGLQEDFMEQLKVVEKPDVIVESAIKLIFFAVGRKS